MRPPTPRPSKDIIGSYYNKAQPLYKYTYKYDIVEHQSPFGNHQIETAFTKSYRYSNPPRFPSYDVAERIKKQTNVARKPEKKMQFALEQTDLEEKFKELRI